MDKKIKFGGLNKADKKTVSRRALKTGTGNGTISAELEKARRALQDEIIKRLKAEATLQAEQKQFDNVLDTLPCYLVLLSPDYHVPFANKFFRERFGESNGRRCYEYLFNRTEPCEVCETFKVLQQKKPLEWEWVGPDGHDYYIYDFPFKAVDGSTLIMEVGIDITVQKTALKELRKAHDEAEAHVEERTRELKKLNRLLRAKMVEHKQAEQREKIISAEWQATFDSITDMVSIQDSECRLIRVNKAYAETVGIPMAELADKKCFTAVHHTECPIAGCPHMETVKTHEPVTREIFEPGLGLYLQVTTSPIFNEAGQLTGSVHIAKDITERKKADELLRTTLESIGDGFFSCDADWRFVYINAPAERILGVKRDEVLGKNHWDVFPLTLGTDLEHEYRRAAVGEPRDFENFYEPWGRWFHNRVFPREGGGVSVYFQDITERIRAEREMLLLNRELRAISECNQAIVRAADEQSLLNEVCRIMCSVVNYRMAWVGLIEYDEHKRVRPVASFGDNTGYLDGVNVTWADTELGRGPTGTAARTRKTDFCQDFVTDPRAAPWRESALARGYRSSIAIPLLDSLGNVFAVFSMYSAQPNGFTTAEVALLEELTGDLSFGIMVLRERIRQRQTAERLRETRDYLDNLINYANAPIITWNPEFNVTRFNRAFERLTGRSASEVLSRNLDILFPAGSRETSMKHIHEATSGEHWETVEIPILHKDGSERILLWNSATIYTPDGKTAVSMIAQGQDITDRKRTERMKDEFIGLVSHELRTPLTVITGSLRTAISPGINPVEVRELLDNAIGGADQLAAILENMLELSRHQAGHLKLRVEPVSIMGTARSVINRLKNQGATQNFSINIPADLPPVEADPVRLERILYNLIENAAKYSPQESNIKVTAAQDGQLVITSVIDEGPGISEEDQPRLFELFQQLETSTRARTGAGLGLVVCKRLVEAQGGWIKLESAVGKGSKFYFALPRSSEL